MLSSGQIFGFKPVSFDPLFLPLMFLKYPHISRRTIVWQGGTLVRCSSKMIYGIIKRLYKVKASPFESSTRTLFMVSLKVPIRYGFSKFP